MERRADKRRDIMDSRDALSNAAAVARLIGEFLREAAVLVAVFVPLDWPLQSRSLTLLGVIATISGVVALLVAGIVLEMQSQ